MNTIISQNIIISGFTSQWKAKNYCNVYKLIPNHSNGIACGSEPHTKFQLVFYTILIHTIRKGIIILNKSIKKVQCNPSEAHHKRESNKSNRTTWSKHLKPFKRTLTNSSFFASKWEHFSYLDSVLSRSSPEVEVLGDQRLVKMRPWHFRSSNEPKPWEAHE